jgi:hypothetical protein
VTAEAKESDGSPPAKAMRANPRSFERGMPLAKSGQGWLSRGTHMAALERGDHVEWDTSQGRTRGTVVGKATATTRVKGWTARASRANPQVEVRSDKSGATAVHHPDALKKVR